MQQPAQPPGTTRQVNLELPAGLTAIYSNAVVISQTLSEVVLDFVQVMPNDPRARVLSRIVMTPTAAKLFLQALGTNITQFEGLHGEIKVPPQPPSLADQLFKPPTTPPPTAPEEGS
ncbi:MAG: DUF3467 domain-containing protein [Anaerolineae bacterium]|jgi:hypothetical protein|nr:DUF3467 domain-containing protein [Anaerolineae bacterium]